MLGAPLMNPGSVLTAAGPSLCPGTQALAWAAFLPVPFSPIWGLSCTLQVSWAEVSCSVVYDHLTQRHSRSLCKPGPIPSPESIMDRLWFWSIQVSKSFGKSSKHLRHPSLGQPPAYCHLFCTSARHPDKGHLLNAPRTSQAPDTCARPIPSFSLVLCISGIEELCQHTDTHHCSPHPCIFLGSPLVW